MTENRLEDEMLSLSKLSKDLLDLLAAEKAALIARDLESLGEITEKKLQLCDRIEQHLAKMGPEPLSSRLAALPEADRAKLEPLHKTLVEQAQKTQDSNAVNGKIVRRSQKSVQELMNLMSGTDTDLLYGAQGHARAPGQGTAIARA